MTDNLRHKIRSYVTRPGRVTKGQSRAIDQYWDDLGLEVSNSVLDLDLIFGRHAPVTLEIGSGMGEVILGLAKACPENNHIAVEVHTPGIGSLLLRAHKAGLHNLKIIREDIVDILPCIPDYSLDKINIFFPDPWPKKRHHKRRLVQPDFISGLTPKLCRHGCLFLATDWEDLAFHMLSVCNASTGLVNLAPDNSFTPRPTWRIVSKFESRGHASQHGIWNLAYCSHTPVTA